jgi:hypothetical protein
MRCAVYTLARWHHGLRWVAIMQKSMTIGGFGMNANEMKNRVKEILSGQLTQLPHDISVPKLYRWEGLEPIPQEHFTVEYHGEAAHVLGRVDNRDQRLLPLRRPLRIEVDLSHRVAHVFLGPSDR